MHELIDWLLRRLMACSSDRPYPSLPNTWWVGVWNPKRLLRRLSRVPNTFSPGIWRSLDVYVGLFHLKPSESIRNQSSWTAPFETIFTRGLMLAMAMFVNMPTPFMIVYAEPKLRVVAWEHGNKKPTTFLLWSCISCCASLFIKNNMLWKHR